MMNLQLQRFPHKVIQCTNTKFDNKSKSTVEALERHILATLPHNSIGPANEVAFLKRVPM